MKKVLVVALAFIMALSMGILTACGGGEEAASGGGEASGDAQVLSMSVTPSEQSVWMVAAETFKEEVEKNTEGRFEINIYPNEQLSNGDLAKGVEQLISGQTDLDIHSVMIMSTVDEKFTVVTMPWLFANGYDDVDKYVFNGEGGEKLKELIENMGAHCMALGENGFRQLTNNVRPVHTPEDTKGLKLRIPSNNMYISLFKKLGSDPTTMNFAEVFTALQQGTIDGQENPMDTIKSAKLEEVQKYLTVWNYSYDPIALSASNKLWESLSDEDKEIFTAAAEKACAAEVEATRESEKKLLEEMGESMEINTLTADEIAAFREVTASVYEEYKDKIGEEYFNAFGYEFK